MSPKKGTISKGNFIFPLAFFRDMLVFGGVKVPEITQERHRYDSLPKLVEIGHHVTFLHFSLICIAYSLDLLPPRMPVTTRIITFLVALGIQLPCQWMIGVSNHLLSISQQSIQDPLPFSEGEWIPRALGRVGNPNQNLYLPRLHPGARDRSKS